MSKNNKAVIFRLSGRRRWDQLRWAPGGGQGQCELPARGVCLQRESLLCGEHLALWRREGEAGIKQTWELLIDILEWNRKPLLRESIRVIGEIEFIHMVISTNSTWKCSISLCCCCSLIGWRKMRIEQYFSESAHSLLSRQKTWNCYIILVVT